MAYRDFEEGRSGTVGQIGGLLKEGEAYEDWKSGYKIHMKEEMDRESREREREEESSYDSGYVNNHPLHMPILSFVNILVLAIIAYCVGSVGGCFHRWKEYQDGIYALNAFKTTGVTSAYVVLAIALPIWFFWIIHKISKFFENRKK